MPCPDANVTSSAWAGVTCLNGHVAGIVLENMGLVGPLSGSLANLTMLQEMSLGNNSLSGQHL
jgi:hypothetical protein